MTDRLLPPPFTAATAPRGVPPVADVTALSSDVESVSVTGKTKGLHRLVELPAVRALWWGGLPKRHVDTVASMTRLRRLVIFSTRTDDLSALGRLRELEVLIVEDAPRVDDVSFLRELPSLRALQLSDMPRLRDFEAIANLTRLRELTLSSGVWNRLEPQSLEPLRHLQALRRLGLAPGKGLSLEPLSGLTSLEELELNLTFPLEEVAKLHGRLPRLRCPSFENLVIPFPHDSCGRCWQSTLMMPIDPESPKLCQRCDAAQIRALETRFREIAERARRDDSW